MVNALNAASAYRNQMRLMENVADGLPEDDADKPSFSGMVKDALNTAAATQASSENLQMDSLAGAKVDLADLVTAVANAELSLNTMVAVRDRVINAYNDIVKMPI